jgi:spermidine synthase
MQELWYWERAQNISFVHRVRNHILSTRSSFQQIDIVDTYESGKMLFLDNMAQSAQLDEFIYHEMMVHPALLTHPNAKKVCIIGGAEGATLREVLKHNPDRVVMVDIDGELVQICKEHLPEWSTGAFDDPRVELKARDGRTYLQETGETFDAIIIDLSDPLENAPSTLLFTREFYEIVRGKLNPGGCLVVQSESFHPKRLEPHARIRNTLRTLFKHVRPYCYLSHSFHEIYSFTLASSTVDPSTTDVESALEAKGLRLRYYSPELHRGLFNLPGYLHEAYAKFTRIITDKDVVHYPDKR